MNQFKEKQNNNFEELSNIIYKILDDFNISIKRVKLDDCEKIEDVFDCILDSHCMMYEKIKLSERLSKGENIKIIAFIKDTNQPVKLIPTIKNYKYTKNNSKNKFKFDIKDFNDIAYIIHRPLPKAKTLLNSILLFIYKQLSKYDVLKILITSFVITIFSSIIPSINKIVLDTTYIEDDYVLSFFILTLTIYLFASIGKLFFANIKRLILNDIVRKISLYAQSAIISKILLQKNSTDNLFSITNVYEKIKNSRIFAQTIINNIFDTAVVMFFSIIYLLQIYAFEKDFILPFCIMLTIWIVFSIFLSYKNVQYEKKLLDKKVETNSFSLQVLNGIEKIKNSGLENTFTEKMISSYTSYLDLLLNPPKSKLFFSIIVNFILSLISVVILTITATKRIPIASYIAFSATFGLISTNVQQLVASLNSYFSTKPMITQLEKIINLDDYNDKDYKLFKKLENKIEFINANCLYKSTNIQALNNVNLTINKGEKVAIVGKSGAGKSTILRNLLGIDKLTSGDILFDGISINDINLRSLRKRCGSVFQYSSIIPGTIKENIVDDMENSNDDDVIDIIKKVALDDFVNELPFGINTEINESSNSSGLSGGQIQRILLAKALYRKPDILLLDEATSALDNISQAKVFKTIYEMEVTTIMVAHRLSTIKFCDKIIVVDDGKIIESGTFDELMNKKGEFYDLASKQE